MTAIQILFVMAVVGILSTGQILFKFGAIASLSGEFSLFKIINRYSVIAVGLYAIGTALWIILLRKMPLSQAYPLMALSFIFVPACAALFLGEAYNMRMIIGGLIIVAGVYVSNS